MYTPAVEGSEPDSPVFGPALITLLCCESLPLALCVRRVGGLQQHALTAAPLHLPTDWPAAAARSATNPSQQPCPAILPSHRNVLLMEEKTSMPAGHACAPFLFLVLHVSLLPHTFRNQHENTLTRTHTHTDTDTDTDTDRQRDRETERQRDTERHRETQRDTERHRETQRDTERHRETQRHRDTQTHRHTDTQTHRHTDTHTHDHGAGFDTCLLHSLARVCSRPCPCLCECARKYRTMMLQLPDNNRRFAALPAQYSAACDRLSLFGVSCRGNFFVGN